MCLSAAAWMLGCYRDYSDLRRDAVYEPVDEASIGQLAKQMGLATRPVPQPRLADLTLPLLLPLKRPGGYLLVARSFFNRFHVYDPARGWRWIEKGALASLHGDVVYEIAARRDAIKPEPPPRISARSLLLLSPPVKRSIFRALALTGFMQIPLVLGPLYMRTVVDEVVVDHNLDLLNAATLGVVLLYVFNALAALIRSRVTQELNSLLAWNMARQVTEHLLRLPLAWFQQRRLADVMNRVQGVDQVRLAMGNGLAAVFDAFYCVGALAMLIFVAPLMALIALVGLALYIGMRSIALRQSLRLSELNTIAAVSEQQKRMENIRAIQTIKILGAEVSRERTWGERLATALRVSQENSQVTLTFSTLQNLLGSLISVTVIYVGALLVLKGEVTVGFLTAALAYQGQFSLRAAGLYDQIVGWKMLKVPLERIADVVLAEREPGAGGRDERRLALDGALSAKGLGFRYAPDSRAIVEDLELSVEAGEHVAITGPSGVGKSTLIKLLCGLYAPTTGQVLVDGRPIVDWGAGNLRRSIGIVLQDDVLLEGTIAENISFFEQDVDRSWVWECLALAGVDEEVRAMPRGLDSLIGDLGQAVSGGQKQRLLLARSLYVRPKILMLDEATSHLDPAREKSIVATLKQMNATRIVVAHRAETIAAADRVLRFVGGRLIPE